MSKYILFFCEFCQIINFRKKLHKNFSPLGTSLCFCLFLFLREHDLGVGVSLDGAAFTYTSPGLYFPSARVTDLDGNHIVVRGIIEIHERAGIDGMLTAKWNAMKTALIRDDLDAALAQFSESQRDRYRTLFGVLRPQMAQIARDMQDLELIYVADNRAKYRIRRQEIFGGRQMTFTYFVYFVQDGSGLWSIESF